MSRHCGRTVGTRVQRRTASCGYGTVRTKVAVISARLSGSSECWEAATSERKEAKERVRPLPLVPLPHVAVWGFKLPLS